MPATLDIRVLALDDLTVVGLDGALEGDLAADRVGHVVAESLARDVGTIVLDCSLLDSLDERASAALQHTARCVHRHHGQLIMRQPSPLAKAVLDLTGTSAVVEFGD